MAINVIRYEHDDAVRWGRVDGDVVHPIRGDHPSTRSFVTEAAPAVLRGEHETEEPVAVDDIAVLSPVTPDQQYLCQAVNYRAHMEESGLDPETSPFNIFFRKASSSIAPATTDIVCPSHVEFLDYEVEIGLVLAADVGTPRSVATADLGDHVAALVALNDVSGRDVQLAEGQFYKAKSYRTFGPAGPHLTLVDAEDLARFADLRLRLWVNGELRQDDYAAEMVHGPADTLTELSAVQDWRAGDLLATGTPGGCALQAPAAPLRMLAQVLSPKRRMALVRRSAMRNRRRLRAGDRIELHIGTDDGAIDLGRHHNIVVASGPLDAAN
jgi:2-keto-4-pentenoate hydratase/2-oxohepta-3-ene-1,7-dioic acid hydratase in catechol pathway